MDWIIWVIVIVVVVAIIWWLMNRNKNKDSTLAAPPAATAPAERGAIPDTAAAAAGVAGIAGVTNLGTTAAEGSGPVREEPKASEPEVVEPEVVEPAAAEPAVVEPEVVEPAATEPAVVEPAVVEPVVVEPAIEEPVLAEPTVDTSIADQPLGEEPVVAQPALHEDAAVLSAQDSAEEHEPAVEDATHGDAAAAADKAAWEASWTDASGAPIHHSEYTEPHSPTLPGAESAAAEEESPASPSGHLAADHPYGTGSSSAAHGDYPVKATSSTMTFHDEGTAGYDDAEADVWFESAAHAEAAGFRPPRRSRH